MNIACPERAAIEFFWDKLSPGAPVVLDDYAWEDYSEQKAALDDFAHTRGVEILTLTATAKAVTSETATAKAVTSSVSRMRGAMPRASTATLAEAVGSRWATAVSATAVSTTAVSATVVSATAVSATVVSRAVALVEAFMLTAATMITAIATRTTTHTDVTAISW